MNFSRRLMLATMLMLAIMYVRMQMREAAVLVRVEMNPAAAGKLAKRIRAQRNQH
jgi:hypothetical protein